MELARIGQVISEGYSDPGGEFSAAIVLGFAGRSIGAAATIRYVRHRFGSDFKSIALSAAGWEVVSLVAVVPGMRFRSWE